MVKEGDLVRIRFLDHSQNCEPGRFRVIGEITEITKDYYKIHNWIHDDPIVRAKDNNHADNEHYYSIVKKTITELEVLKPRKEKPA